MTDDQQEMVDFLMELCRAVERGEITGIVLGVVTPAKQIQTATLGACSREPVRTIGIVRLMSLTIENNMWPPEPPPSDPAPTPLR